MSSAPTAKADGTVLTGVSETALLTLQVRAHEARRPDSVIDDPMAIQLADSIDYDFAKFGFSRRQDMAVRAISDAYPFEREVEGHHSYVTFVTDEKALDELAALAKAAGPDEKIKRGKGVIYWQVPKTGTLDTTIGKTMGKKRYKSSTTTRNLRTIDKALR